MFNLREKGNCIVKNHVSHFIMTLKLKMEQNAFIFALMDI